VLPYLLRGEDLGARPAALSVLRVVRWEMAVDEGAGAFDASRRSVAFGAQIAANRADVDVQYLAAEWDYLDNMQGPGSEEFSVMSEHQDGVGANSASLDS
jgi:hypothetical protein